MTILTKGKRKKKMRHSREKEDFGRINASTLGGAVLYMLHIFYVFCIYIYMNGNDMYILI